MFEKRGREGGRMGGRVGAHWSERFACLKKGGGYNNKDSGTRREAVAAAEGERAKHTNQ